jgi:GNAT superfamily N-acetyltransferase
LTLAWLDNIAWHSLCGAQAHLAAGSATARRYARGLAPIIAFFDLQQPDFVALAPHCHAGEHVYSSSWSGPAPPGWQIEVDARMLQMLWRGPAPVVEEGFAALPLRPAHAAQMLALQTLTKPGPFGPRTLEFGTYLGCFEGPRLVAMAGERMHAGTLREISSVCTDPAFQGRGLARRLTSLLVRQQLQRCETPFLHVMRDNHPAHALYQRMGFRDHQELTVRVLSRLP